MISILCFGDSNTFGSNPEGGRHERNVRWTGVLQELLGEQYYVIEEGMGGRTTVHDDPFEPNRCGKMALPIALQSHMPLDLVIVSLGTNDCKLNFHLSPELVAKGAECLCRMIKDYDYRGGKIPKILLVSPILIGEDLENCPFENFDQASVERAAGLAPSFRAVAERQGCLYLDAASVASPGSDQLHMDAASHRALAAKICEMVRAEFE